MRSQWRYALLFAAFYVVLMTALVISRYGPWGLPERFLPLQLQEVLIWPIHWLTEPLLATDRIVPIWPVTGHANDAAAFRELVVYAPIGAIFYASIGALLGRWRQRKTNTNNAP